MKVITIKRVTLSSARLVTLLAWLVCSAVHAQSTDPLGNTLRGYLGAPLVQTSQDVLGTRLEGIVPGPFPVANSLDGNGARLSTAALLDEGEPTGEGALEGEGAVEGGPEGTAEGSLEGSVEGSQEGQLEGEGDGSAEGSPEGAVEGATEGLTEGSADGEGEDADPFETLLFLFASLDADANSRLTLAEILAQLPAFPQQPLQQADANGDDAYSVPELLALSPRLVLQSADSSGDYTISLSELLRVVQLYNAGGYACAENPGATEDGYLPQASPGTPVCLLHSLDSNADNQVSLSELLRGIQLYNLGEYTFCPGQGEDEFCGAP